MKKHLLNLLLFACASIAKSQDCSDLIISEYVEGTGNNKAIEIYNASSSSISLSNYRILRHDNGNTSFTAIEGEMNLPSNITLASHATYVIALNLTDPMGTGQTAPIDLQLQALADTLLCDGCGSGHSRVMCFNGDDALALQKYDGLSWNDVDIFACRGEQPTNSNGTASPTAGWTNIAPYASMPAGYSTNYPGIPYFKQYWSQDKTLRRKLAVKSGVSVNPAFNSFDPSVQWDSLAANTFTGLGAHDCDCNTVGIKENFKPLVVTIFPNPSKNTLLIESSSIINEVIIYSVTGQVIKKLNSNTNIAGTFLNVSDLIQGIYFMSLHDKNNNSTIKKIIIE